MVGAPGLSGGADGGLRGGPGPRPERGGRGPGAAAACPAHSPPGRAGGAGGCAGRRPATTIPPAVLAAESRGCRGIAARDGPGGRLWAGEGRAPRWGRDLGSGTRRHTLPSASAPSLPPSGPPGSTFLPPLSSPSPPSKPPPGCHTVSLRRGGANSGPGQLRPERGPARGRGARGSQVQVPYAALTGGPPGGAKTLRRVSLCFLSSLAPRGKTGTLQGANRDYFELLDFETESRYGEILPWPPGSPKVAPPAARSPRGETEAPAGVDCTWKVLQSSLPLSHPTW
ncbi:collagen alpha-1(I) chain-like isoform X2 [Felis catus]|uniref:collagen alpha-1(I) chain-like isoform X2 n=1 Tax=Felis catus TaxID=9685 RepID=UPI001D198F36|nr:collagen alpha-1(I) chain-like isoform X2 [Felis catus]